VTNILYMNNYSIIAIILLIILIIIHLYYYYEYLNTFCCVTINSSNNTNDTNNEILNIEKFTTVNIPTVIGFNPIKSNKLYYGVNCKYIKNDAFYTVLNNLGYKKTNNIHDASLIVPCTYDNVDDEINTINNIIDKNKYGDAVRIYMLNNTDYLVSKMMLWIILKKTYGEETAATIMPKTYDLSKPDEFRKKYKKGQIYILKNNKQRQEGLKISMDFNEIINSNKDYLLAQELLQNPYCIDGYKINLRVYCLVIKDNYGNYNLQIYNNGIVYYTNEKFEKGNPKFEKNITTGYCDGTIWDNHPFTHHEFRDYLDDNNRNKNNIEKYISENNILSDYVFFHIYTLLKFVFKPYVNTLGNNTKGVGFQLYGADIAINDDMKPMLMEINKGPDMTIKAQEKHKYLKIELATNILQSVGLIENNNNNNFIKISEEINMNGNIFNVDNC